MNGPNIRVISAPACEPVSLVEAKQWCRVDSSDQDATLNLLIQAARERAEEIITGSAFVQRELEVVYDAFPANGAPIELPCAPLISVQYIKWFDTSGVEQTLEGSPQEWILDTVTKPGRIQPLVGEDWPAPDGRVGGVRIGFTCGYAFSGSPEDDAQRAALPAALRNWMHVRVVSFFDNRSSIITGTFVQQPPRDFIDGLLDGLIVRKRFA